MGLIVDALKQLVEQGDLDIECPNPPAVTSIRLTTKSSSAPERSSTDIRSAADRLGGDTTGNTELLGANQSVMVESSVSPSSVDVVETEAVDSSELSNFDSYDSLLSDVDNRLDSIEQSLDSADSNASSPVDVPPSEKAGSAPTSDFEPTEADNSYDDEPQAPAAKLSDKPITASGVQPSDIPSRENSPATPREIFEEELPEIPETDSIPEQETLGDRIDSELDLSIEQGGPSSPAFPSNTPNPAAALDFNEPAPTAIDEADIDIVEPEDEIDVEALFDSASSPSPYQPVVGAWADVAANGGENEEPIEEEEEEVCQTMMLDDDTLSTCSDDYLPRSTPAESADDEYPGTSEAAPPTEIEVTQAPVESAGVETAAQIAVTKLTPTDFDKKIQTLLADSRRRKPFEQLRDGIDHLLSKGATKSILILTVDTPKRSADVTSTLASLYGETNVEPILLVDGAFPGRNLSDRFGADGEGLVEVGKAGTASINDEWRSALRLIDQEGVQLLPAGGGVVANGNDLVDSHDELSNLFEIWKHRYSRIIVDGGSTDSPIAGTLSRACDATFLLVELGQDSSDAARESVESLQQAGGRVMGCIVDDMGTSDA